MFSLASKTSAKKLPQRFEVVSSDRDGNSNDSHNIPTAIQAGDVMVIYNHVRNTTVGGSYPTKVIPSGFTELIEGTLDISNVVARCITSYRVLTDADSGRTITVMDGVENIYHYAVFRFPVPIISVTGTQQHGNEYWGGRNAISQSFDAGTSPTLFIGCNKYQWINSSNPDVANLFFTTQTGNTNTFTGGSQDPGISYYNGFDTTVANTYSGFVEARYGYSNNLYDIPQSGRLDLSIT